MRTLSVFCLCWIAPFTTLACKSTPCKLDRGENLGREAMAEVLEEHLELKRALEDAAAAPQP